MVKIRHNVSKLKSKTTKNVVSSKLRKNAQKQMLSTSQLDYTLPEDNHLDSFDRFLVDGKRKLRPILKKDIRASFNRDSSIEYDSDESTQSHSSEVIADRHTHTINSSTNENNESEKVENVDPNAGRKSFLFGCSINSSNSWMFSRSTRERRRRKKASAKGNQSNTSHNTSIVSKPKPTRNYKGSREVGANEYIIPRKLDTLTRLPSLEASTPTEKKNRKRFQFDVSPVGKHDPGNKSTGSNADLIPPPDNIETSAERMPAFAIPNINTTEEHDLDVSRPIQHRPRRTNSPDSFMQTVCHTIDSIIEASIKANEREISKIQNESRASFNPSILDNNRISMRRRPKSNSDGQASYSRSEDRSSAIKPKETPIKQEISSNIFETIVSDDDNSQAAERSLEVSTTNNSQSNENESQKTIDSRSYAHESSKDCDTMQNKNDEIDATGNSNVSSESSECTDPTNSQNNNSCGSNNESIERDSNAEFLDTLYGSSSILENPIESTEKVVDRAIEPKQSLKRKVGFKRMDSLHQLSTHDTTVSMQVSFEPSQEPLIEMKGGKWRRTIYDIRKSKLSNSPQSAKRKTSGNTLKPKLLARASRVFVISRKSILVKDITDRRTIGARKPSQNLVVLDESDAESICSSDFSPKPRSINVQPKLRSSRLLQPIGDCVDFEKRRSQSQYNRKSTGLHHLSICSTSSSIDSVVDDLEDLTSSLNLGYDQQELKAQLLKRCGQTNLLAFSDVYSARNLKKCRKIGEGVFGEVFLNQIAAKSSYVLKIIPIEGDEEINGAQQKRFHEILQEIIISQELSGLRYGKTNSTLGFVEVLNVRLVEGRYPNHLLKLWHDFNICDQSENDCPDVFGDDQLYVVFELANSGLDIEANIFKNAEQSFSAFKQVAISLAVAESEFQFEHRDLHWGNVLVTSTTEKFITFYLNGKPIEIPTHGVKATIIDYTLSRLVYKGQCLFQDLAADPELFEATGDYQYDIYRLMRNQTNNYWEVFEPFTNILWLHYMIDKMIDGVRYLSRRAVKHRLAIDEMMKLRDILLEYRGAIDYIENN